MRLDFETLRRLVLANTALLLLNGAALAWLLTAGPPSAERGSREGTARSGTARSDLAAEGPAAEGPAAEGPAAEVAAGAASSGLGAPGADPLGADPTGVFLASTVTPLRAAAADLRREITMPSDAQIAACAATGDLSSAPCVTALELLRQGYTLAGMPFPTLPSPTLPSPAQPSSAQPSSAQPSSALPSAAQPSSALSAPPGAGGGAILEVYLSSVQGRLREAAIQAGDDPAQVLPSPQSVAGAIRSGDPRSAASAPVIAALRQGYARYGLRFTEPAPGSP